MNKDSSNLDMLRSFAVCLVVVVHLLIIGLHLDYVGPVNLRNFGRWGVLMFFVHTCLVLLYSLERNSSFWSFLTRRIFRIYPLSVITVLLVVCTGLPGGFVGNHFFVAERSGTNIFANLTLLQNIKGESVLAPLWSLPFEMQMYLLMPALFYVLSWQVKYIEYLVYLLGLFLALNSWRVEIHGLPTLMFVPCFLAGAIAYRGSRNPANLYSWLWAPTILSITLLFAFYPSKEIGWLCCLLLGLAIPRFREASNRTIKMLAATVAKYSYGIYLMHFICIWIAFDELQHLPVWLQWLTFAALLIIFVGVAYHAVEAPMIKFGGRLAAYRRRTVTA